MISNGVVEEQVILCQWLFFQYAAKKPSTIMTISDNSIGPESCKTNLIIPKEITSRKTQVYQNLILCFCQFCFSVHIPYPLLEYPVLCP